MLFFNVGYFFWLFFGKVSIAIFNLILNLLKKARLVKLFFNVDHNTIESKLGNFNVTVSDVFCLTKSQG